MGKKTIVLYYNGSFYDTGIIGKASVVVETAPFFTFIIEDKSRDGKNPFFYNSHRSNLEEISNSELGGCGVEIVIRNGKIYLNGRPINEYMKSGVKI